VKEILFFCIQTDSVRRERRTLPASLLGNMEIWVPTALQLKPKGLGWFPFFVWWLFHCMFIFKNRMYRIYLIRTVEDVVHRSCLFPPFFRFPFMKPDDLQIGDIWTAVSERRQGLSEVVISQIINDYKNRTIWFLCESGNIASQSLARSAGMQLFGVGRRTSQFGIGFLGKYVVHSC
jgi:hypothetical protein